MPVWLVFRFFAATGVKTMLSEFDKRRLFYICQAVKQLSEDGSLISVFGERLVNHVNKNEPYAY